MEKNIFSNLLFEGNDSESRDMRSLFAITFRLFHYSENYNILYKKDSECEIAKELISLYYKKINPNYSDMIYSFKKKYISNEVLVEKNDTPEQRKGLRDVYDYIQDYNLSAEDFNILVESLRISSLLWNPTDIKNKEDISDELDKCFELLEQAKKEKNIKKYREAQARMKELKDSVSGCTIGGQLRQDSEEVNLQSVEFLVPSGLEARLFINSLGSEEKRKEFLEQVKSDDLIGYIEYCVKLTADLIKYQPFKDGNKRTFRSLLNLMFKVKNMPPVYIRPKEREEYLKVLFEAIEQGKYDDLVKFYYFKICDSIYELDVEPYLMEKNYNKSYNLKKDKKSGNPKK